MLSNENIRKIISDCTGYNHSIGMRDISFILLSWHFSDYRIAYKAIFGGDNGYDTSNAESYNESEKISFLREYMMRNIYSSECPMCNTVGKNEDISFEENKAYMLKLKKDTEDAMERKEIDIKDGLKILADISVKLNDKFNVQGDNREQVVIVNTKFNAICECGREIYVPTKEELIKKYNLIEKKNDE